MKAAYYFLRYFFNWVSGKPPKGSFAQGDKVSFGGAIGTIISTTGTTPHTLQALFLGPKVVVAFFPDGKFIEWHSGPSLKFLGRAPGPKFSVVNPGKITPAPDSGGQS
jgi:hypothetical protein